MNLETSAGADDRFVRRYEYDGETVVVADLGVDTSDASVDVVDGTVIVVADGEQFEFDVGGDPQAFISNGVLTIEVNEA